MLVEFYFVLFFVSKLRSTISAESYAGHLGEVIFTNIVYRHGDRMPLELYPTDPNKESDFPFELAQLTDIGKKQQYELGCWLRQRYSHLLSATYKNEEIYVHSTDMDRTLMSAQCNLAGLYRPAETQEWNHDIHWQPIPIHTVPIDKDVLIQATATVPCPLYDLEMSTVENYPDIKQFNNRLKDVYDYVSKHSGKDIYDIRTAVRLYDTLEIEERYNLSIPEWARSVYPEPLKQASDYSFLLPTRSHLLLRLKVGVLLGEIVNHFQQKRDGTLTPDRRVWMYSAHDMTIACILNAYGVFKMHKPEYASVLLLELRLRNHEYFVTMFYRNSTTHEPHLLTMKGCNTLCPLDQFISLTEPLVPSDWEQECNSVSTLVSRIPSNTALIILAISLSSIIILVVALTTYWMRKQPKSWLNKIRPPGIPTAKSKDIIFSS